MSAAESRAADHFDTLPPQDQLCTLIHGILQTATAPCSPHADAFQAIEEDAEHCLDLMEAIHMTPADTKDEPAITPRHFRPTFGMDCEAQFALTDLEKTLQLIGMAYEGENTPDARIEIPPALSAATMRTISRAVCDIKGKLIRL